MQENVPNSGADHFLDTSEPLVIAFNTFCDQDGERGWEDYVKAGRRGELLTIAPQTLTPVSLPSVCILAAGLLGEYESESGSITHGGVIYIAMVISNRIDLHCHGDKQQN